MAGAWEIRGLFGNEFAMEQAVEELRKGDGFEWEVVDRRNLSIKLVKRDAETEEIVKRILEIHDGFVEHEGPLGQYDRIKQKERDKKRIRDEKKRKRREKR
ncbi:MAG: hypothetical protein ABSB26_01030 [Nitrososphaerales archaeon]|jgi:hypothetical protein